MQNAGGCSREGGQCGVAAGGGRWQRGQQAGRSEKQCWIEASAAAALLGHQRSKLGAPPPPQPLHHRHHVPTRLLERRALRRRQRCGHRERQAAGARAAGTHGNSSGSAQSPPRQHRHAPCRAQSLPAGAAARRAPAAPTAPRAFQASCPPAPAPARAAPPPAPTPPPRRRTAGGRGRRRRLVGIRWPHHLQPFGRAPHRCPTCIRWPACAPRGLPPACLCLRSCLKEQRNVEHHQRRACRRLRRQPPPLLRRNQGVHECLARVGQEGRDTEGRGLGRRGQRAAHWQAPGSRPAPHLPPPARPQAPQPRTPSQSPPGAPPGVPAPLGCPQPACSAQAG